MDLGGVTEIKNEFGVGRNNVAMWAARRASNGFPEPVMVLAMGSLYDMDEVREWFRNKPEPRNKPKAKEPA